MRFGYRRLGVLPERGRLCLNRKTRIAESYFVRSAASQANAGWSKAFTADALASGRAFRTPSIVADIIRGAPALEVDVSLPVSMGVGAL